MDTCKTCYWHRKGVCMVAPPVLMLLPEPPSLQNPQGGGLALANTRPTVKETDYCGKHKPVAGVLSS